MNNIDNNYIKAKSIFKSSGDAKELRKIHGNMIQLLHKNITNYPIYNISIYSSMIEKVKNMIETIEKVKVQEQMQVQQMQGGNSEKKLILFYTDWCGYSKQFLPIWDQLQKHIIDNRIQIKMIKIDCEKDKKACSEFNIESYPTLKLVDNKKVLSFNQDRSLENLITFIKN